ILNAVGSSPGNLAFFLDGARGAFLKRGHVLPLAPKHGAAMRALDQAMLVPVIEITANGGLGGVKRFCQFSQCDEATLVHKFQHFLSSFFHNHGTSCTFLGSFRQFMTEIDLFCADYANMSSHFLGKCSPNHSNCVKSNFATVSKRLYWPYLP